MQQMPRLFCLEDKLGIILNRRFWAINSFNKRKFMIIIVKLIKTKKFIAADLLLKEAMKQYTGIEQIAITFQKKGITDSSFYMKWRRVINNHKKFMDDSKALISKRQNMREVANQARNKERIIQDSTHYRFDCVSRAIRANLLKQK